MHSFIAMAGKLERTLNKNETTDTVYVGMNALHDNIQGKSQASPHSV